MMILIYSLLCAAITLRLVTFKRGGSVHRPLWALWAYLLAVTHGVVPLRALLGTLPVPGLTDVLVAGVLLVLLIGSRGSVCRLCGHWGVCAPQPREKRS